MHTNRQTEVFAYITDRVIIMHHLKGEIMIIYFWNKIKHLTFIKLYAEKGKKQCTIKNVLFVYEWNQFELMEIILDETI